MKGTPNYYAILPANVRYHKDLGASEKILFAEITALSNKNGYCNAGNVYFAELYGVHVNTVSRWVSALNEQGLVEVRMKVNDKKEIEERRIYPLMNAMGVSTKMFRGYQQNCLEGINKNVEGNTTSSNTTSNNNITREFEIFWNKYDKKKGKHKALKKWKRLTQKDRRAIFENLDIFLTHYPDKQYRPYPTTFFNNRYWEDEDFQQPKGEVSNEQNKENRAQQFKRVGQELLSDD